MFTQYRITYVRTGSGEKEKLDRVILNTKEEFEFEHGTEVAHNITEIIELFEMIAAKWWGTYENRNSIRNIEVKEIG